MPAKYFILLYLIILQDKNKNNNNKKWNISLIWNVLWNISKFIYNEVFKHDIIYDIDTRPFLRRCRQKPFRRLRCVRDSDSLRIYDRRRICIILCCTTDGTSCRAIVCIVIVHATTQQDRVRCVFIIYIMLYYYYNIKGSNPRRGNGAWYLMII